ncbi:MAG: nucleoside recognition domain-containing protein, partial [Clostridia bacterium]
YAAQVATTKQLPKRIDFCTGPLHDALHAIAHLITPKLSGTPYSVRFAATKLIEQDGPMLDALQLTTQERHLIEEIIQHMETLLGTDREAALADMRYTFIDALCAKALHRKGVSKAQQRSERIDRVLTHPYLAIPIFLCIMALIFYLTFGPVGSLFGDLFENGVHYITDQVGAGLQHANVSPWLQSLVVDGVMTGVGSVFGFLPILILLFFFLSLLEDSGYMARVAFVMDHLLRKLGLSGRSFVPVLIGFGCSVPAILSTRTLPSARDRKM